MKEKIIKNTVFSGLSTGILGLIGFFMLPFMLSKVGVVEYGLYGISNIFAMGGYISLLEMGFQSTISKYTAEYCATQDEVKICRLITSTFVIFSAIGITLMLLGLAISGSVPALLKIPTEYHRSFHLAICLVFISYLFQFPNLVLAGLFEGLQRFDILKGIQTLATISGALGIIILLNMGYSYIAIIVGTLCGLFIQFLLYFILAFRTLPFLSLRWKYFSRQQLVEIWQMAKFLFAGKISSLLYHQTPRVLISLFLGPIFMTSYDIVARLPRFLKVMLGFLNAAVMPAASELNAHKKTPYLNQLFIRGLRYQIFFIYPVVIGAIVFARPFLTLWVGAEFADLSALLQFMLIWNLVTPIVNYGGTLFVGMNFKLKQLTLLSVVTTSLSVVISTALLWKFQLAGVLGGFVSAVLITFPLYLSLYLKKFGIPLFSVTKDLAKMLVASLPPVGTLMVMEQIFNNQGLAVMLLELTVWCTCYWGVLYFLVLSSAERRELVRLTPFPTKP